VTPLAEARRFDARFFLYVADGKLTGAHDDHETTASFWATPAELLRRFEQGEIQLAPPTHRCLELLLAKHTIEDAVAFAATLGVLPICPKLVPQGDGLALVLPGDPEHDVATPRVPGLSRFVLRGERWVPEAAP
jgi:hypothetical protein